MSYLPPEVLFSPKAFKSHCGRESSFESKINWSPVNFQKNRDREWSVFNFFCQSLFKGIKIKINLLTSYLPFLKVNLSRQKRVSSKLSHFLKDK